DGRGGHGFAVRPRRGAFGRRVSRPAVCQRKRKPRARPLHRRAGPITRRKARGASSLRPSYGAEVLPDAQPPISDEDAAKLARAAGARFVIAGVFERLPDWSLRIEERM